MLVVIKEVLPSEKWVAEPKLLQMMHNRGLVTAQRRDFGVFFRKHAGLLDRMMSGTGTEETGFACIFVNISANEGSARVRHYYKLPSSTSPLRYEMPAADQATREATLRRQRNLPEKLVREYTAEYGALCTPRGRKGSGIRIFFFLFESGAAPNPKPALLRDVSRLNFKVWRLASVPLPAIAIIGRRF